MRKVYSIIFLSIITVVACNTKTSKNKVQNEYPFVEFDSMCLISIDSKDFAEAIDSLYKDNNHLIVSDYMKRLLKYSSHTCNEVDKYRIINFFTKKSVWNSDIDVACEPIYRNAIICYNKSKLVATTLICFDCQLFLFQPTKHNRNSDLFIEDILVIKDVFEKNGLKAKHIFNSSQ